MKRTRFIKADGLIIREVYRLFYSSLLFKKSYDLLKNILQKITRAVIRKRMFCHLPWESLVVNCDGTVSCSCADPFKLRVMGDANKKSVTDIWKSKKYKKIRTGLLKNKPFLCYGCDFLSDKVKKNVERPVVLNKGPKRIWIEPSIICNLSCLNSCCSRNTPIRKTRKKQIMDLDLFKRIIDDLTDSLEEINLFNYGEPFVNPFTFEMIHYAKKKIPHVKIFATTNGMLLNTDEKRKKLIDSGIDKIMFSIDGASQKTYSKYRRGGNFNVAYDNMKRLVDLRNKKNQKTPRIIWRYILFNWNDSDKEMENALRLSKEAQVDEFYWEITDHPIGAPSKRFYRGSKEFEKIKKRVW